MFAKKMGTYRNHFAELTEQGIRYAPFVMSCYGRLHPDATHALEALALRAALRHGFLEQRVLLRRFQAGLGVRVWKRLASMVRACVPRLSRDEMTLLVGADPAGDEDGHLGGKVGGDGVVVSKGAASLAA